MMDAGDRLGVRTANVISEITGGEAVIIDLDSGTYYSLDRVGTAIWSLVERGAMVGEVPGALAAQFEATPEVLDHGARTFLRRLEEEGLITIRSAGPAAVPPPPQPATRSGREPFAEPVLSRYTDIQDLLLLDPVHEVDEDGWPSTEGRSDAGD